MQAGVDILVVAGGEAGGHCGDVSTMVLIPEVHRAVTAMGANTPILAAGGIATGAQMAAAMAMGAAGAWCGSVWLTTSEAEPSEIIKQKMLAASSRDTVRSRSRTGKPSRQLRSPVDRRVGARGRAPSRCPCRCNPSSPNPPSAASTRWPRSATQGASQLATYWVGQGVGLMNQAMSCAQVVQQFREDFLEARERLIALLDES